jgi:protein-tyrosine phosphatase
LALISRRLDWPDCRNTRDLGGLPCRTGVTRSGVLIRSDNVASLTAAGRQAMIDYGVTTVIDLRAESELKGSPGPPFSDFQSSSAVAPRGTESESKFPVHLHRPLVDDETASVLNQAATMPDRYMLMVDRRQAAFGAIFTAIAEAEGPVLFHCFAGKDRTGLVAAMMLSLAGVESEEIGADYAETDAQLATRYAEWLAKATPERVEEMRGELRCPPEWILSTLEHVERTWGGVDSYLEAAGVAPDDIDRLTSTLA